MRETDPDLEVLLVSRPVAPGLHDGTVSLVRTLARAGAAAGWRCSVLVPAATLPPPGVAGRWAALPGPLRELAWRPLSLLSLATAPTRGIRHYFFTPSAPVVTQLRRLHRLRPGPTVQTLCSTPADSVALGPLIFADRVVALSEHTRSRLLADGVAAERIVRIPPAVELPARATPAARRRVRHRLALPESTPLVLYLGDYDTAGAARAVAEALPAILTRTDAHAVLACRPKGADHQQVQAMVTQRLATAPPAVRSRVHQLGTISWSAELAAAADVALFPARRLPDKMDLPLALLESMVAGVPAVTSDTGPLADLVHAGAAVGVDPADPDRVANETVRLLADPAYHARASSRARDFCKAETSPRMLVKRHRDLYRSLLETHPS